MTSAAIRGDDEKPSPKEKKSGLPNLRAPKRLLSSKVEKSLTARQIEILDALDEFVLSGKFGDLTMAEIAKQMTCSLRTLYGIAPSKEELVLAIADRHLQRIGREAMEALRLDEPPLARLRAYLRATNLALQPTTVIVSTDFNKLPGARKLADAHADYIVAITRALLDEAVAEGQIDPLDTGALALVLGRLGREFSRPQTEIDLAKSPRESADDVAEIILDGLSARNPRG